MSTTTGTNNLPVPQSSDSPDVVRDITALANATDPLLGPYVCTSTTRPAAPTPGQRVVWETDTQRLSYWDGTAWWPFNNPPRAMAYPATTAQTIGTGVNVGLQFDAEAYDTDGMHSTTASTDIFTSKVAGLYEVKAQCDFPTNSTGLRQLSIWKNGSPAAFTAVQAAASGATVIQCCTELDLAVNDYVQAVALQSSGGNLTLALGSQYNWCSVRWVARS